MDQGHDDTVPGASSSIYTTVAFSQYNDQQEQLKKDLTKLFTDVQYKISNDLLISKVIDPGY